WTWLRAGQRAESAIGVRVGDGLRPERTLPRPPGLRRHRPGAERTVELAVHPGGGAANWSEFLGQPGGTVRGLWQYGRAGRPGGDWRRPARADEPGGRDARLPGGAGDRDAGRRTAAWSDDSPRRLTDLRLARQRRTGVDGASVFATQVL